MKNYLTVLARGIDGCGVTKNSIEFTNYINSIDISQKHAHCIAHSDSMWGNRSLQHSLTDVDVFDFVNDFNKVKNYIDHSDIIIFNCVPIKKQSKEVKDMFIELLKYAKSSNKKTVYFNLDRKKRLLKTNMYDEPEYKMLFEYIDIIFNDCKTNDFHKYILEENNLKYNKIICRNDKRINSLFGIDFEAAKSKFWKSFSDKEQKTLKFIGRSCKIKGAWLVRDLHRDFLRKEGYITTIEGIDMSIGTLPELLKSWIGGKANRIPRDDVNIDYIKPTKKNMKFINEGNCTFKRNMPAYMMAPYIHDAGLERLSKCQFGIELFNAADYLCKDAIENAMFEIVAVGCIPIFRKFWAENFILDGKSLYEYGTIKTGTIFMDEKHPEKCIELMNKLSTDKAMYDKFRNTAYSFYKKYFDVNSVYKNLIAAI